MHRSSLVINTGSATSAEEYFNEGVRFLGLGESSAAEIAFKQALEIAPYLSEAHINLGILLTNEHRWQEAEKHYRQALDIHPVQMEAYLNFGGMLLAKKAFIEAEAAYRQALLIDPVSPGTWSSLGVLMACMKREDEAEKCYRHAMAIAPEYRKAPFNLAYLLLRQGRYEEGWACLEARDWYTQIAQLLKCSRWHGESITGKNLLISIEAGHGDMIQFCRYASMAKQRGCARVTVLCHPGLKRLFASVRGVDDVIAVDEPLPATAWDYWVPPLSLPFIFGTQLDTIPADIPYLFAQAEQTMHWSHIIFSEDSELRVGLVWKGNPRFENDADRSLASLCELAPLGDVTGIRYFSLQKGAGEDEVKSAPFPLIDLSEQIQDFADTAAIMMNLDLIISVDTAVAHLAGALGKDCWLLLPSYKTDWRWMTDQNDSPWYPKVMRIFRQSDAGDWTSVVAELRSALLAHLHRRLG